MYGIAAEHYLEYAALRGDASDNLPGVPGIGRSSPRPALGDGVDAGRLGRHRPLRGATLVATLDSYREEVGRPRIGASVLKRLATPRHGSA